MNTDTSVFSISVTISLLLLLDSTSSSLTLADSVSPIFKEKEAMKHQTDELPIQFNFTRTKPGPNRNQGLTFQNQVATLLRSLSEKRLGMKSLHT